jgi:hypothetical protein
LSHVRSWSVGRQAPRHSFRGIAWLRREEGTVMLEETQDHEEIIEQVAALDI